MYCSCTCGSLTAKITELLSIVTVLAPSACPDAFLACKDSRKEGGEVSHDAGGVQNAVRRRTEELHVIVFDVDNVFIFLSLRARSVPTCPASIVRSRNFIPRRIPCPRYRSPQTIREFTFDLFYDSAVITNHTIHCMYVCMYMQRACRGATLLAHRSGINIEQLRVTVYRLMSRTTGLLDLHGRFIQFEGGAAQVW